MGNSKKGNSNMKSDFGYLNYKCLKIAIAYMRTRQFVQMAYLYKWTTTYICVIVANNETRIKATRDEMLRLV